MQKIKKGKKERRKKVKLQLTKLKFKGQVY